MASKKKSKKTPIKPLKRKSGKPSSAKAPSRASTSIRKKKSPTSKKSSKVASSKTKAKKSPKKISKAQKHAQEKKVLSKAKKAAPALTASDFTLVTLDAKTRRVITPKRGTQVFFAWKSRQGKIYPIESQYSQAYYKTDAEGILQAFRAGSPDAYNTYKELTQDVSMVLDKEGKPVIETGKDRKTGEVRNLYRWKLTGRNVRHAQSIAVASVKGGFITPLSRGFTAQEPREIPSGDYIKVPVTFGKAKRVLYHCGSFVGDSIRDALKRVLPDTTTAELARRGIKTLGVDGFVDAYRPENPYAEETPDWEDREKWANKIWKDSPVRRFRVGAQVPSLMDFASRVATGFRTSFSSQGLRVTSLVGLEEAEDRAREMDDTVFKLLDPIWPSVILEPQAGVRYKLSVKGREGAFVSARKYRPMRYEATEGEASDRPGSKYATRLELYLSIKGF